MDNTVKVADFKIAMGKLGIPVYAVKQLLNWLHGKRSYSSCGKATLAWTVSSDYIQIPFQGLSGSQDPS
jgi:hypothetical protein